MRPVAPMAAAADAVAARAAVCPAPDALRQQLTAVIAAKVPPPLWELKKQLGGTTQEVVGSGKHQGMRHCLYD